MLDYSIVVLSIFMGFALLEVMRTRLFHKAEQSRNDAIVEIVSTITY